MAQADPLTRLKEHGFHVIQSEGRSVIVITTEDADWRGRASRATRYESAEIAVQVLIDGPTTKRSRAPLFNG